MVHFLFLFFASGCSDFSINPWNSFRTRGESFSLAGKYEEAWQASLDALFAEGIPIQVSDVSRGFIQSKTFLLYSREYKAWSRKPLFAPSGYCMIEIGIGRESEEITQVGIRAFFRRKYPIYFFGVGKEDKSRGIFEKLLLGRINDHLVKKKWPKLESIFVGCNFRFDTRLSHYRIAEAEPGSLAYEQGLRTGDVLLEIDGKDIQYGNLFEFFLDAEGEKVSKFKVRRGRKKMEIPVSIFHIDPKSPRLGMIVRRDKLFRNFNLEEVLEDSPAEIAGLRKGDILLKQNGMALDGWVPYYRAAVNQNQRSEQVFLIERNGVELTRSVVAGRGFGKKDPKAPHEVSPGTISRIKPERG